MAFFIWLFLTVQKNDFLRIFRQFDPLHFTLSFVLMLAMIVISCWKWKVLLDVQGDRLAFHFLMRTYFIGYYFSNFLPSSAGSDVARSYYVGRLSGSQTRAAVSVFMERVTGLFLHLVLVIVAPLFNPGLYQHPAIIAPALCALGMLLLLVLVGMIEQPMRIPDQLVRSLFGWENHSVDTVGRSAGERLYDKGHAVIETFHEKLGEVVRALLKEKRRGFQVIALTLLFYGMTFVNVYWAFKTFGVAPSFVGVASVVPTIMLLFMIPVSLGNLGLAEVSYVFYYSLIGIQPAVSLVMALFIRFKIIVASVIGFGFYLAHKPERTERETLYSK